MVQCLACKRKDSTERCINQSIVNFMYCGRHVKIKDVKPWIAWRPVLLHHIVRIQALWRGYIARKPLKLAGKGVLKRNICINDDEMITMESKDTIHPYDFFSLEEDGKVWFFDQRTIIQWAQKDLVIRNPYTRTQLSNKDTARIRMLYLWRRKRKMEIFHDKPTELSPLEKRDKTWMRIAQILREFGYDEVHHEYFISLGFSRLGIFINSLVEDFRWWTRQKNGRSAAYFRWLSNIWNMMPAYNNHVELSTDIAYILLTILHDMPLIETACFYIFKAYSRASVVPGLG